jgi:hypothetical protein
VRSNISSKRTAAPPLNSSVRHTSENIESMEIVSYLMLAMSLANACALLYLQVVAYRRHHHQSFLLLTYSTLTALLSLGISLIPRFVPDARAWYLEFFIVSAVFYFIYAVLGVWGVASLFRSYGALRQGA